MKIEVWSDVICPFCYIGKRKLEAALKQLGLEPEIRWRSFELNPGAPQSYGFSLPELLRRMYGLSPERAQAMLFYEEGEARKMGIDFNWRQAKPGNTFDAHRLLQLARQKGISGLAERLFHAYFTEGREIGDPDTLRSAALDAGLDARDVEAVLAGDLFADEVRADERKAEELGIHGVPHFIFNNQAVISGAREVSAFVSVLGAEAAAEGAGAICKDGVCEVAAPHSLV